MREKKGPPEQGQGADATQRREETGAKNKFQKDGAKAAQNSLKSCTPCLLKNRGVDFIV